MYLADIKTVPGSDALIIAKTLPSVRNVVEVCIKRTTGSNDSPRSCVLEIKTERIQNSVTANSYITTVDHTNKKNCKIYYI